MLPLAAQCLLPLVEILFWACEEVTSDLWFNLGNISFKLGGLGGDYPVYTPKEEEF